MLAGKHPEARFMRVSVDKAPFLCTRMKIRVLPTIVLFKDFKSCDYIIGFDDLGGHDEFSTEMMEWRIAQKGTRLVRKSWRVAHSNLAPRDFSFFFSVE